MHYKLNYYHICTVIISEMSTDVSAKMLNSKILLTYDIYLLIISKKNINEP